MEGKQSSSGLQFKLHPLVFINISDHHTRMRANNLFSGGGHHRVLGCLLGQQMGRVVDISNSFEIKYEIGPQGFLMDEAFLIKKQEQYKQVFPKLDVVGWYATGSEPRDLDMVIHRKIMDLNESPVFLRLDPVPNFGQKDLPVSLFESELHVVDGASVPIFVQSTYTVETSEAERIGVNQVAKILPSGNPTGSDQLSAHLTSMHAAIKMLHSRLSALYSLLEAIAKGEAPVDHALLRATAAMLQRLPVLEGAQFQQDFLTEYNDSLLTIYLSAITKGTNIVNDIVDKSSLAYDKTRRSGPVSRVLLDRI